MYRKRLRIYIYLIFGRPVQAARPPGILGPHSRAGFVYDPPSAAASRSAAVGLGFGSLCCGVGDDDGVGFGGGGLGLEKEEEEEGEEEEEKVCEWGFGHGVVWKRRRVEELEGGFCVLLRRVDERWIQRDLFPMQELNVNDEGEASENEPDDKVTTWSKTMQGTVEYWTE